MKVFATAAPPPPPLPYPRGCNDSPYSAATTPDKKPTGTNSQSQFLRPSLSRSTSPCLFPALTDSARDMYGCRCPQCKLKSTSIRSAYQYIGLLCVCKKERMWAWLTLQSITSKSAESFGKKMHKKNEKTTCRKPEPSLMYRLDIRSGYIHKLHFRLPISSLLLCNQLFSTCRRENTYYLHWI